MSSFPNQPNPNPIQSVIDRGKPEDTERVFVVKGKTYRLHKVGSSDRTGKPVKLSEDIRVKHAHDGTRELVKSIASTHIVNNLFLPNIVTLHHLTRTTSSTVQPTRRTLPSTSWDAPNSTVKRSHGVNVHNLIQKIENHPQRQALQSDLHQHRAFQPFQQRITRRDQSSWKH